MEGWTDQREFVRYLLHRTGWSQTVLARRAGIDPSTLSRFLASPEPQATLRPSTLLRLEQATGLSPEIPFARPLAEGFEEARPMGPTDMPTAVSQQKLAFPGTDAWHLNSRALELAGYLPGDILFLKLGETPLRGDVVCAQNYDWPAGKAETIFRIFEPPFLIAATTEPRLMRPFAVDDEAISIKGVVVSSLRIRPK
jgi:transcriptional regulator with XRE-family HTH domain